MRRDELQPDDAGDDEDDAGEPQRACRLAVDEDAEGDGADGADPGPDRVGRAERQRAQRQAEQSRMLPSMLAPVNTVGVSRVKPSVYPGPTAQPISNRPATKSANHDMER